MCRRLERGRFLGLLIFRAPSSTIPFPAENVILCLDSTCICQGLQCALWQKFRVNMEFILCVFFSFKSQSCALLPMPESSCVQLYSCLWQESLSDIYYSVLSGTENLNALLDLDSVERCLISWLVLHTPILQHFVTYLTRQWRATST